MLTAEGFHVPVIALSEVVGKDGTVAPAQNEADVPKLNVGVIIGFTVTAYEVVVAHWPAVGVKVYVPEFWLSTVAGLHVPVIPFNDVVGNVGTASPAQMDAEVPKLNVGVILGFTVTLKVAGLAHCPALGVNVYVPEFWSSTVAGLHVPLIPFVEVPGNAGTVPPAQIVSDVPKLNVGVVLGTIVTFTVTGIPHWPPAGVNV